MKPTIDKIRKLVNDMPGCREKGILLAALVKCGGKPSDTVCLT